MAELPRAVVVRNPRSGTAPDVALLIRAVTRAGLNARVLDAPEGDNFTPWLDRLASEHDLIVAAGGDGTVSTVAAAVARAGKTLGVIPTGTLNHFARDNGIPGEMQAAAALIARGTTRKLDVGVVNDRIFINNVSLGNYPRMVHEREALERNGHSHAMAATIAIARTWWHLRKLTVALEVDGRGIVRRSPFIVVGNGSYVLSGLDLGKRNQINDGRLSLYIAPPIGRLGVLTLPMRALAGRLDEYEQFETICASRITATLARRRITAAIDGEVVELTSPIELSIRRGALNVVVEN